MYYKWAVYQLLIFCTLNKYTIGFRNWDKKQNNKNFAYRSNSELQKPQNLLLDKGDH